MKKLIAFVVLLALAVLAACESTTCTEYYPGASCWGTVAKDCCPDYEPAADT